MSKCPKSLFGLRAHKWITQESQDSVTKECVRCGKKETIPKLTAEIYRGTLPEPAQKAFDDLILYLIKNAKFEKNIAERVAIEELTLIGEMMNTLLNYDKLSVKERQAFMDYWVRGIFWKRGIILPRLR